MLWALVMLSFVAITTVTSGRFQLQLAGNLRKGARAEAAADGAVYETLFHLLAAGGERWAPSGKHEIVVGDERVEVIVENLAGRINPNTATPELLRELLLALGTDPPRAAAVAGAIVDWRTPQPAPPPQALQVQSLPAQLLSRGGAKASEYRAEGYDYGPPGTPFASIDELGAVLGMTPDLLARLRPHLTLWWGDDPDPAAADPAVTTAMRALGDTRPQRSNAEYPIQAVDIVAEAAGSRGGRFRRHADAIVNRAVPGTPWRILAWDTQTP